MNAKPSAKTLALVRAACEQYSGNLHRYLIKRLGQPEQANDAAQEVYERLLRYNLEDAENPLAYVYRVASNVANDLQSREQLQGERVVAIEDLPGPIEEDRPALSEEDPSERLNLQLQLERALAQLPRMHAAILLCTKRDGLTYAETARKVGLPLRKVRRYFVEASERIRMMTWDR